MPGELGATSRTTITRLDFGRRDTRGPVLSSVRSPGRRQNTGFRRSGRLRHRLRLPEGEQHGTLRPVDRNLGHHRRHAEPALESLRGPAFERQGLDSLSYTHLRAHETVLDI